MRKYRTLIRRLWSQAPPKPQHIVVSWVTRDPDEPETQPPATNEPNENSPTPKEPSQ